MYRHRRALPDRQVQSVRGEVRVLPDANARAGRRRATVQVPPRRRVAPKPRRVGVLCPCEGARVPFHAAAVRGTRAFAAARELVDEDGLRGSLGVLERVGALLGPRKHLGRSVPVAHRVYTLREAFVDGDAGLPRDGGVGRDDAPRVRLFIHRVPGVHVRVVDLHPGAIRPSHLSHRHLSVRVSVDVDAEHFPGR